jgi:hypothetical protein
LLLILLTAISCIAAWRNLPLPHFDDLFYGGAGLALASGEGLTNDWIRLQGFPSEKFYVYPPFHAYALAAWCSVFGISSASIQWHVLTVCAAGSFAAYGYARRATNKRLIAFLLSFVVWTVGIGAGLRPDALGLVFIFAGAWCLGYPQWSKVVVGGFLLALGIGTSPRMLFNVPLVVATLYVLRGTWPVQDRKQCAGFGICVFAGATVAVLLFLLLIRFEFREFWEVFRFHGSRYDAGPLEMIRAAFNKLMRGPLSAPTGLSLGFASAALLGLAAYQRRWVQGTALLAVGAFSVAGVLSAPGALQVQLFWIPLGLLLMPVIAWTNQRRVVLTLACVMALVSSAKHILPFAYGVVWGYPIKRDAAQIEEISWKRWSHVLVDGPSLRSVFGYVPPENAVDWLFSEPFPHATPSSLKYLTENKA